MYSERNLLIYATSSPAVAERPRDASCPSVASFSRRRRSGLAGAGLSLYARLISHFNIVNIVI